MLVRLLNFNWEGALQICEYKANTTHTWKRYDGHKGHESVLEAHAMQCFYGVINLQVSFAAWEVKIGSST